MLRFALVEGPCCDVQRGETGELIIRGPQVMLGYWNRPEATANAIRGGWLYTGDLAVEDEDGYFKIVGRKKDMVITSGFNVYPDEIDRVLASHPAVREACSIGVPDSRRGEIVKGSRAVFSVQMDAAGKGEVVVRGEGISPALLSCYRSVAKQWTLPVTGQPYATTFWHVH